MNISVLILTKNEEQDLPGCLESVSWCDDIHVFDSFSTDRTIEIARQAGGRVTQRVFDNWSAHQNWGLANLPFRHPWVLYIDADERVSPELRESALSVVRAPGDVAAFRIRRRDFFVDGTWLKHAQISPYYLRLFRPQKMRYERLVNPVSIVDGSIGEIGGYLDHYPFSKGIDFWVQRHLKYADFEARTIIENRQKGARFSIWRALFERDFSVRRFHQKEFFYRLPFRPWIKFVYMTFLRRGFLDGRAGLTYARLQTFYEFMILQREREIRLENEKSAR
jgi:glycosyltransferase involved in cell wall biosynthesis